MQTMYGEGGRGNTEEKVLNADSGGLDVLPCTNNLVKAEESKLSIIE